MPRHVVTLSRRVLVLPTHRNEETRQRIEQMVVDRFRARVERDPDRIEMDFPKRMDRREARDKVAQALNATDARWRRVFVLYPKESWLRTSSNNG